MENELLQRIDTLLDAVAKAKQAHRDLGLSGAARLNLKLWRRCNGKTARVAKGVVGYVLQHGDGAISPSIVQVDALDLERYLRGALNEASRPDETA